MPTAFAPDRSAWLDHDKVLATLTSPPVSLNITDIPFTFRVSAYDPTKLDYLEIGIDGMTQTKKNQIMASFQGLQETASEDLG